MRSVDNKPSGWGRARGGRVLYHPPSVATGHNPGSLPRRPNPEGRRRDMALSVIIVLYVAIGLMSAAGSIAIAQRLFSPRGEQIFFGVFLVPIAGFYLAFTAYFGDDRAWRFEIL